MDDEFLQDLNNQNFVESIPLTKEEIKQQKLFEKEQKKAEKQKLKEEKELQKEMAKLNKQQNIKMVIEKKVESTPAVEDSLFDDKGTEIIGNERRVLLNKITSYKSLFPVELKSFKIKKKATNQDLKDAIEEMDSIINTSNIDSFLMEGFLSTLKVIEGVSANTKNYNLSGMVDLLKTNSEFISISKRLFLKYNVFQSTPIEYQATFIIFSTAMLCRQKNLKKDEINSFLNQPYI